MADPSARAQLIETALEAAIRRQGVEALGALDLTRLAADIEAALERDEHRSPLDPEGDGLKTKELNAANDI